MKRRDVRLLSEDLWGCLIRKRGQKNLSCLLACFIQHIIIIIFSLPSSRPALIQIPKIDTGCWWWWWTLTQQEFSSFSVIISFKMNEDKNKTIRVIPLPFTEWRRCHCSDRLTLIKQNIMYLKDIIAFNLFSSASSSHSLPLIQALPCCVGCADGTLNTAPQSDGCRLRHLDLIF